MRFFRRNGQAATVEYVLAFLLVVGAISAMMIYVRRAVQGRHFDAHRHMISSVSKSAQFQDAPVKILTAYEPYYASTSGDTTSKSYENTRLLGSGNFIKETSHNRTVRGTGTQTPPREDAP